MSDPSTTLTPMQRAMLDLALECDLLLSAPGEHDTVRARHHAIRTPAEADGYIRGIETRIHGRRHGHPHRRLG